MKTPKAIQTALNARPPDGPINIFDMAPIDIVALGYLPLSPTDEYQDGDLIGATKTAPYLWIIVNDAPGLRKALRAKEIGANISVYRK